jgi:hypothetical protein
MQGLQNTRHLLAALVLGMTAAGANAADWATRTGDTMLTPDEVAARIGGQSLVFYDGGTSVYGPGSDYAYVYTDGDRVPGEYRIAEDGAVCIAFRNGATRCDLYVLNNGRMLLIDEKGDRYPVR